MIWKIILEFKSNPNEIDFSIEEVRTMLGPVLQYELFPGYVVQVEKTTEDFRLTNIWRFERHA